MTCEEGDNENKISHPKNQSPDNGQRNISSYKSIDSQMIAYNLSDKRQVQK